MSKNPRESKIETYLKEQIAACGGLCYKFKSTVSGVPDQLVIYRGGLYLVEVKRPGKVPRTNQRLVHATIKKQGVTVYNVDREQQVDDFIANVLHAKPVDVAPVTKTTIESKNLFADYGTERK